MNKLLLSAWLVFALDLIILGMMAWQVAFGDFAGGEEDRAYAVTVTIGMAVWLAFVNLALVFSWWRDNRTANWVALVAGALPLLWAWTAAVSAITDWATATQ